MWGFLRRLAALAVVPALILPAPAVAGPVEQVSPWPGPYGPADGRTSTAETPSVPMVTPPVFIDDVVAPYRPFQEAQPRSFASTIDPAGHLLAILDPPIEQLEEVGSVLRAIDPATGGVVWTVPEVSRYCSPAVGPDGTVWITQSLEVGGYEGYFDAAPAALLGLDPVDGSVRHRLSLGEDEGTALLHCESSPTITTDGTVAFRERRLQDALRAVDGSSGTLRWTRTPADLGADWITGLVAEPASGHLLVGVIGHEDPEQPREEVLLLDADGTVLDRLAGHVVTSRTTAPHPAGGVVRSWLTLDADGTWHAWLARLDVVDDAIVLAWQVEMDPSMTGEGLIDPSIAVDAFSVAVAHGFAGLEVHDLEDGALRWAEPAGAYAHSGVVLDAGGHLLTITGPYDAPVLRRHDPDGPVDWEVRLTTLYPEIAAIDADGTIHISTAAPAAPGLQRIVEAPPLQPPAPAPTDLVRIAPDTTGGDVVAQAIATARAVFGDTPRHEVVLARSDVFADALAGASLAGGRIPILFTAGGPDESIDQRTLEEIERVLIPGGTVHILGGQSAVGIIAEVALQNGGFTLRRHEGHTRYETAAAIAEVIAERGPIEQVLLASGEDWPDAVTAGAYGAAQGVPVLLTPHDRLHPAAEAFLATHPDVDVVIVGGEAAVGEEVSDALPDVRRVAGPNRWATAAAVLEDLWLPLGDVGHVATVELGAGDAWAAALAAAVPSAAWRAPQVGLRSDEVPSETATVLEGLAPLAGVALFADATAVEEPVAEALAAYLSPATGRR